MLWNFSRVMKEGDVLFAKLGRSQVIGWGLANGELSFDPNLAPLPHIRPVHWEGKEATKLPAEKRLPIKSLTEITENRELLEWLKVAYPEISDLDR